MDFPFHEVYSLDDYNNSEEPAVFFGMYRYEDLRLLHQHQGKKTIFWTGQDALKFDWNNYTSFLNVRHITAHPKVYDMIRPYEPCELVKPAAFLNQVKPQQLGPQIYAYCPNGMPEYHGKKILDELKRGGYHINIGDGQWTQKQWRDYVSAQFYNDIFIGLCLSEFAGGGGSIIEMGLRGIRVVTNVFNLPNCIPFNDVVDVANLIEQEKIKIGTTDEALANGVWNALDHEYKWL